MYNNEEVYNQAKVNVLTYIIPYTIGLPLKVDLKAYTFLLKVGVRTLHYFL